MKNGVKRAAAFMRKEKMFLHPDSRTTRGFWILSTPVVVATKDDKDLGAKIMMVLSQSRDGVPHPVSWKRLTDPLLRAAGARSFAAFAESAKSVDISLEDGRMVFTPSKNGGPRNAFLHLNDKSIRCLPSEAEAADCLRAAFDACE
jgi:hypothetical protein